MDYPTMTTAEGYPEASEQPRGAVFIEIERIRKVCAILQQQAEDLAQRLEPVVREAEEIPDRSSAQTVPAPSSALAGTLDSIALSVERTQRFLYSLAERVDL